MKYIIHACPERMWYVKDYLIPSLLSQDIAKEDIIPFIDHEHKGILWTTMESYEWQTEGAWHLQDDILISSKFRTVTQSRMDTVVCGYCSAYIVGKPHGLTNIKNIWYSSPCIYIPHRYANECADWFYTEASKDPRYQEWVKAGKCDDEFFKIYMIENYPNLDILQLSPNIVEHVDWLIGGSMINPDKKGLRRSKYWVEPDLVDQLAKQLQNRSNH